MSHSAYSFRVHPAIGFSRVGNSPDYYLAPETAAGMPLPGKRYNGGIPINAKTNEPIKSSELRDAEGRLVRHAQRFRIYAYATAQAGTYPVPEATEITLGSKIDGRTVVEIIWQVHLANKKANQFVLENPDVGDRDLLIQGYENGNLPPIRNLDQGIDGNDVIRLRKLVIDPGPRALKATEKAIRQFNVSDVASYYDATSGEIVELKDYPKSFPDDSFSLYNPWGVIDTLGEMLTDAAGRLIVPGGYGRASAIQSPTPGGGLEPAALNGAVDNDGWFDDCSDGPIDATLVFDDGSRVAVHGAWLNVTDPSYAPQTQNAVSLWDDIYDTWVQKLNLEPDLYVNGVYNRAYKPWFPDQVLPFFVAAATQRWNTNLPSFAIRAHEAVGQIKASDNPKETIMSGLAFVRNPNLPQSNYQGAPFMPLSLGDNGRAFLSPRHTQYFLLEQWDRGDFRPEARPMGAGEQLDRDTLINCLGGRFSPGIDMTFIIRQPGLYYTDWRERGCGPFRIHRAALDYAKASSKQPFLSEGWVPVHRESDGLEPGDGSKFMSIPWHTDYNSCGTHQTAPNPADNTQPAQTTLYWSWPAQRPFAVYTADDARAGNLDKQRFSIRGFGTASNDPSNQGRYQQYIDFLKHWPEVGTILQATQIDTVQGKFQDDWYLEVQSQLDDSNSDVQPWPINGLTPSPN